MRLRFSFPNPVNDVAARTVATGVVVMASAAIGFGALWLTVPLAYGFIARVGYGPRFSPLGRFATAIIAPRFGRSARLVPGPPKRFAQAIGAIFTTTALICWLAGAPTATTVLLAILLLPAIAEAGFGYCIGCEIFRLAMAHGLIPASVCEECASFGDRWASRSVVHQTTPTGSSHPIRRKLPSER